MDSPEDIAWFQVEYSLFAFLMTLGKLRLSAEAYAMLVHITPPLAIRNLLNRERKKRFPDVGIRLL